MFNVLPKLLGLILTVLGLAIVGCGTRNVAQQPSDADWTKSATPDVESSIDTSSEPRTRIETETSESGEEQATIGEKDSPQKIKTGAATDSPDDLEAPDDPVEKGEGIPSQAVANTTDSESTMVDRSDEATEAEAGSHHRFMIMAPQGPLVVELVLSVFGKPLDQMLDGVIDEVMQRADGNEDGKVTWDELTENDELRGAYLSNLNVPDDDNSTLAEQFIQRYDTNNNRKVDREEVPRMLASGQGNTSAITLKGSNYYRESSRYASPLFALLDVDEDTKLSRNEIAGAADMLKRRDYDLDEHLHPSELGQADNPSARQQQGMSAMRNERYAPIAATLLREKEKWSVIRDSLRQLYAEGATLSPENFSRTPDLFAKLDTNDDGRLFRTELPRLAEVDPHLQFRIDFGSQGDQRPSIQLIHLDSQLESSEYETVDFGSWWSLLLADAIFDFFYQDLVSPNILGLAKRQLTSADADNNEYIDKEEFENLELPNDEVRFADIDADENGMIHTEEIVSYIRSQPSAEGSRVHVRVGHQRDSLFIAADTDRDGRLNPAEVASLGKSIARYDHDNDEMINVDELPESILVAIVRGSPDQADATFGQPVRPRRAPRSDGPKWFAAMDANLDGVISVSEFLGTAEQFLEFDGNGDRFLQIDEVKKP